MSSTDGETTGGSNAPDPIDALAGALWDEAIAPLAEAMRKKGERFFATGPDPAAATYFGPPTHRAMSEADFAFPGGGEAEALVDALAATWAAENRPELVALVPRLKQLAAELKERPETEDPDVSPFVYTMY